MEKSIKKTTQKKDLDINAIFLMTTKEELYNDRLQRFLGSLLLNYPVKVPLVIYFDQPLSEKEKNRVDSLVESATSRLVSINYEITYKQQKIDTAWLDTTTHFLELISYKVDVYQNMLLLETDIIFISEAWFDALNKESIERRDSLIIGSTYHTRPETHFYNGVAIYKRTDKLMQFIKDSTFRLLDTHRNYDYALSDIAKESNFSDNYFNSEYILDLSRKDCIGVHTHNTLKPKAVLVHTKSFFTIVCVVSKETVNLLADTLSSISNKNLFFYDMIIYYQDDCLPELEEIINKTSFENVLRLRPINSDIHKELNERITMLSCVKDLYTDFVLFVKSGFIFTEEHIINGLQSDKHRICFPKDNEADYAKLYNQKADKESYLNEKFYVFDMYYMHPDGLFLTTKLSLDCVSSKFLKTYKMDYSQYCFKRALELGIDITHKSKVDRGVLSKVFEKIEWMKYFCFNFADCRKSMFLDSSNMIISKHGFIRKVSILERFTHFIKYIAEAVSKGYSIAKKKTL